MWGVYIFELDKNGHDRTVGCLGLVNGRIRDFPTEIADRPLLLSILQDRPGGPASNAQPVSALEDPLRYLDNLRYMYKSAYLRASQPQEINLP